jgi:hypothetical protein
MKMITKTKRVGGSLMVVVPKGIVDEEQLVAGQEVEIEVARVKKKLWGICKGIGPWIKEEDRPYDHRDD